MLVSIATKILVFVDRLRKFSISFGIINDIPVILNFQGNLDICFFFCEIICWIFMLTAVSAISILFKYALKMYVMLA